MQTHSDKSERLAQRKQCDQCGEWFLSAFGMYYHKQIHNAKPQKCDICQKDFPHRQALLSHNRKYHRECKFQCSYCERKFDIKSKLKVITSDTPKLYALTFPQTFVIKFNVNFLKSFQKHEESHTRHNVYSCRYCSKMFNVVYSLKTHIRRNHREEHDEFRRKSQLEPA